LERQSEELDAAKQWIGHFRSRITEMFCNVSKEMESLSNFRSPDEAKPESDGTVSLREFARI
jgi:hypothetical protein